VLAIEKEWGRSYADLIQLWTLGSFLMGLGALPAGWIADNRLTELQLHKPAPAAGREDLELEFGGRKWQTHSEVSMSGTPGLLRIRVWVATAEERRGASSGSIEDRAVTSLTGFVGVAP